MLGTQFYHETIRRLVVTFGTIFNDINIVRKDNNGNIVQKMKVPLAYGPKQKFLVRKKSSTTKQLDSQYMPVPYNLDFELYAMAKQSDDALQMVEQILPYFQPDYTVTINDMADMGIKRDVPIILNSINNQYRSFKMQKLLTLQVVKTHNVTLILFLL